MAAAVAAPRPFTAFIALILVAAEIVSKIIVASRVTGFVPAATRQCRRRATREGGPFARRSAGARAFGQIRPASSASACTPSLQPDAVTCKRLQPGNILTR